MSAKAGRGFQMKTDLQGFVSQLMQVLETELGLSARAESALSL